LRGGAAAILARRFITPDGSRPEVAGFLSDFARARAAWLEDERRQFEGKKELVGLVGGVRESSQSWKGNAAQAAPANRGTRAGGRAEPGPFGCRRMPDAVMARLSCFTTASIQASQADAFFW